MHIKRLLFIFIFCLPLTTMNTAAKGSDPCQGGDLKGWAKNAGYTQEDCTADSGTVTEREICDGTGKVKGWARKEGYTSSDCNHTSTDTADGSGAADTNTESDPISSSATLNWQIPTTRENGDVLSVNELGGYELYITKQSTGELNVYRINDPLVTNHTFESLTPDTYYFSISAFDTSGLSSQLTQAISIDLPLP